MANPTINNIKGYVLHLSAYKENDAMVKVLSADGIYSFLARGVNKPTSKLAGATQLLSFSQFSLLSSNGGALSLKEAQSLKVVDGRDDLGRLTAFSFLAELSDKLIQEDEAVESYPWLEATLQALDQGFDPFTAALVYFAHLLIIAGYGLDVDECIVCGAKKDIAGISYSEGGFICRNDLEEGVEAADTRKLKILRYIFRCQLFDLSRVKFEKAECQGILNELSRYLNDLTGVSLKSIDLFLKA
jgi:DNA repair protein RecO (recombination protein O)